MSLLEQAQLLEDNAVRLRKLIELDAPKIVVESARASLFKKLFNFPVDEEARRMNKELDDEIRKGEQEFLSKHGYYEEIANTKD